MAWRANLCFVLCLQCRGSRWLLPTSTQQLQVQISVETEHQVSSGVVKCRVVAEDACKAARRVRCDRTSFEATALKMCWVANRSCGQLCYVLCLSYFMAV